MLAAFLLAVPARADEEPLQDELRATLTDLLPELRQSYGQAVDLDSLLLENNARRQQLSDMIRAARWSGCRRSMILSTSRAAFPTRT